jgi:CBS-domain-containing membrane protein
MKNWRVDDVMTTSVVTAGPNTEYRKLVDLVVAHRFSAVPGVVEVHSGLAYDIDDRAVYGPSPIIGVA